MATQAQQEHPDNPSDEKEFDSLKDSGVRYRILGTAVGAHQEGDVVSAKDLGRGASLRRLLNLGVISPLSDEEAQAHKEARGEATLFEYADASRADPRLATGGIAPAPGSIKPPDRSGPVRDDRQPQVVNPPKAPAANPPAPTGK